MSTTEIYGIEQNGNVTPYGEAQNSWLGGMHVWKTLNEKYNHNDGFMSFKNTWKCFNNGIYESYEDVLLGGTFDHVIVKKDDFPELIENFEKYVSIYPNSNFAQQVQVLKEMLVDGHVIGVAWCQTSVADDLWDFGYDDEDELIPYNVFKGEKHWDLFEEIKKGDSK